MTQGASVGGIELPAKIQFARFRPRQVIQAGLGGRRHRPRCTENGDKRFGKQKPAHEPPLCLRLSVFDFGPLERHVRPEFEPVDVLKKQRFNGFAVLANAIRTSRIDDPNVGTYAHEKKMDP